MTRDEAWPAELAQLVVKVVGPHDGPILVYAEDYLGGAMETGVTFRRGDKLDALNFLAPDEQDVLLKVQSLYQQWGGRDGDVRALRLVVDGENVSARLLNACDVGESNRGSLGFRSRLSALTIEVFGRDWREGDGTRPEILQRLDANRDPEVRRERTLEQLRRMLKDS